MTNSQRLLVPISGACEQLGGVSRSTIYKLIEAEEIDLVHIGRRSFVTGESLTSYVERLQIGGGQ